MRRGVRFLVQGPGAYHDLDDTTVSVREFVEQADYLMDLLKGMLAIYRLWSAKIGSPCRARGSSPSVT